MSVFDMANLAAVTDGRWGWEAKRLDAGAYDLSPLMGFSDRGSYLAWVASWKAAYGDTVARIRSERAEGRRWRGKSLGLAAHNLLVVRRAAKAEAARQWLARRSVPAGS